MNVYGFVGLTFVALWWGSGYVEWKGPLRLVEGERFLPNPHRPVGEVGTVNLALLAKLRQQLDGLQRVAPLVVPARIVPTQKAKKVRFMFSGFFRCRALISGRFISVSEAYFEAKSVSY